MRYLEVTFRRDLITSIATIFSDLIEPVAAEDDEATAAVAARTQDFAADVGTASVAWHCLAIDAVSASA